MSLKVCQLELKELNELVSRLHRHHKPVQGHRFSLGVMDGEIIVGGCSVGRPVARKGNNPKEVLEVTRLVTDGTKNACSFLYSRAAKIGKLLGYKKIQTYILETELGTSLLASGWKLENAKCRSGQWKHTDGKPRRTDQPICKKQKWVKILGE